MVCEGSRALVVPTCLVLRTGPGWCDSGHLSVKKAGHSQFSCNLTTKEWLEKTVGTLVAGQLFDCHMYPVFGPVSVGLQKPSPCGVNLTGSNLLCVQCIGVSHSVKIRSLETRCSGISIYTCALFLLYSMSPVGAFL